MSLLNFIGKQFVDVIEWADEPGVLAFRYPMQDREIQNGAQLTVREAQAAAFLNEGQIADLFSPGLYTLNTRTLPILTSLANWDKAFASPFKSDVYFFSLREQVDRKWGVAQPITLRDKDFGAIRLRAFGRYSFAVADPRQFWTTAVGNLARFTAADIEPQLQAAIVTALATAVGGAQVSFLDMAQNQTAFSERLNAAVAPEFARFGLRLTSFFLESLSVPEEVQAMIDRAGGVRAVGDLGQYTRFQAAQAIPLAAENPGGLAALGAGAAAGWSIGQTMGAALGSGGAPNAPAAPDDDPFLLIEKLHRLLQAGAISQEEFDAKKSALLAKIG